MNGGLKEKLPSKVLFSLPETAKKIGEFFLY